MFQWLRLLPYRNLPFVQASDIFILFQKVKTYVMCAWIVWIKSLSRSNHPRFDHAPDCNPIRTFETLDISKEPISKTSRFWMFWYKRGCKWLCAIKGMALRSRGFSRGSLFKTWPKPETAHEKSLAPRVVLDLMNTFISMDGNSTCYILLPNAIICKLEVLHDPVSSFGSRSLLYQGHPTRL